jgi:GTP-binding protein Era
MQSSDKMHKNGVVAIIGPPNAGKSTLLNNFVGCKLAIVTPKPQTTRNQISGILTRPELQIVFLDTPGIHRPGSQLNSLLVQVAWQALAGADLSLLVCDAALATAKPTRFQAEMDLIRSRIAGLKIPLLIAVNKIDLLKDKNVLMPIIHQMHSIFPQAEIIPVSASHGENTDHLLQVITSNLLPGPPLFPEDQLSTLPLRFLASEVIREKLFLTLDRELPYSLAVAIEHWAEDTSRDLVTIHALIYVPKQSHKGIVIGQQGKHLKLVGQQARQELENLLSMHVHLQLWVKIKPKWTENQNFVLQFLPELSS